MKKIAKQLERTKKEEVVRDKIQSLDDEFGVVSKKIYHCKEISEEVYEDMKNIVTSLGGFFQDSGGNFSDIVISKKPIPKEKLKLYDTYKNELFDIEDEY